MASKMACIQCDSLPGQPKPGYFWICEDCFYEMDTEAWVGRAIKERIDKDGTITIEEINRLIHIAYDTARRFGNLRTIRKEMDKGNLGPLVEAAPKEYAIKRFPEYFDENGKCKSNVLVHKEVEHLG